MSYMSIFIYNIHLKNIFILKILLSIYEHESFLEFCIQLGMSINKIFLGQKSRQLHARSFISC